MDLVEVPSRGLRFKYFVTTSAGISKPGTLAMASFAPVRILFCSHRYLAFKCGILPMPLQRRMPISALASVWTVALSSIPKSCSSDIMPRL